MMNTAAIKRFLMLLSSVRNLEQERLYQLLSKAEFCYCLKDTKGQYELGVALSKFREPFNIIGDYYQALHLYRIGKKDEAYEKLLKVQDSKTDYADKASLRFGAIKQVEGDFDEAIRLRADASKSGVLPIVIESAIGTASILGAQGQHTKALEHLESVLPLIDKLGTHPLYFDTLNSYAVELAEAGKIDEATRIITPVIKSPYTAFYPNWLETEKEIAQKSNRRSVVTFEKSFEEPAKQPKAKILAFPTQEPEEQEDEQEEPEPVQSVQAEPSFSINKYLFGEFNLRDKVDDWLHGETKADDLGTLAIALEECKDHFEKDMIIGQLVDAIFPYSPEAKEAKEKWYERVRSKMKESTRD